MPLLRLRLCLLLLLALGACAPSPAAEAPLAPVLPATDTPAPRPTEPPAASPTRAAAPAPSAGPPTATPPGAAATTARPVGAAGTDGAPADLAPSPLARAPLSALAIWGHGAPTAAAFSPDGESVAVATALHLELRAARRLEQRRWAVDLPVPAGPLAFSPDGATIALGVGAAVELRDAADGSLRDTLVADGPVADLSFAPDGLSLAAAAGDLVRLWDLAGAARPRDMAAPEADAELGPPGEFTSVAFGPGGQLIVAGDENGNLLIWTAADGALAQAFSVGLRVVADVAVAPDGITVAAASEGWRAEPGAAWVWDISAGGEPRILTVEDGAQSFAPAERLAFSPDGAELALGAADGTIVRWPIAAEGPPETEQAHRAAVVALAYAPDGASLLSAARDGLVRIDGLPAGAPTSRAALTPAVSAVALSPDGAVAAAGGEDGSIALLAPDGVELRRFAGHEGAVNALTITPDGATLISAGDDGLVRLWSLPGGTPRGELRGHSGAVLGLAVDGGGARLASSGDDGTVRLWRLPEGKPERSIVVLETDGLSATAVQAVALTPDGATVAAGAFGGEVRLFRAEDGADIGLRLLPGGAWTIGVAYAPGGELLAALDSQGQAVVWGADGETLGTAEVLGASALAWAGDRVLATAGGERGAQLWALGDGPLVALATAPSGAESIAVAPAEGRLCLGSRAGLVELRALR